MGDGVFESVYKGPELESKQWLGVLGNHDYGGWKFNSGWSQTIAYTWGHGARWMTPAQFWSVAIHFPGFSVDHFFVDTNYFSTYQDPREDATHNLCSLEHSDAISCASVGGPASVWQCREWFSKLWHDQAAWLEKRLSDSNADWQIVVMHHPPHWGVPFWGHMAHTYGIDLFVTGHMHLQKVYAPHSPGNFLTPTSWVITGGGG